MQFGGGGGGGAASDAGTWLVIRRSLECRDFPTPGPPSASTHQLFLDRGRGLGNPRVAAGQNATPTAPQNIGAQASSIEDKASEKKRSKLVGGSFV